MSYVQLCSIMFPSFSFRASSMQEHGKSCFWCNFSVAINFGSVRSALHQRVPFSATEAHLSRLEEPEWATSDRLSYEEQVGRAPFFNCSASFGSFFFSFGYTFQVLVSIRIECWINYWMDTKTAACGQVRTWLCIHPCRNDSASRQALHAFLWVVQSQSVLCWPTVFKDFFVAVVDSHLQIQSYKLNNAT